MITSKKNSLSLFLLCCIAVIMIVIFLSPFEKYSAPSFEHGESGIVHNISYLGNVMATNIQENLFSDSLDTYKKVDTKSNGDSDLLVANNSESGLLVSINESNSEILSSLSKLTDNRSEEILGIISTYFTVISFLIGVATFILAFFMQLEFDRKLTDAMKRSYRLITIGLVLPCAYMITHGIYLIMTGLNNIAYLIALILTALPIGILLYFISKKVR